MEILLVEARAFKTLMNRLEVLVEKIETTCPGNEEKAIQKWLDNQDVCDILGISKRTLQTYREKGLLPFSRIRHKIFYKPEDINRLLQSSYHFNTSKE